MNLIASPVYGQEHHWCCRSLRLSYIWLEFLCSWLAGHRKKTKSVSECVKDALAAFPWLFALTELSGRSCLWAPDAAVRWFHVEFFILQVWNVHADSMWNSSSSGFEMCWQCCLVLQFFFKARKNAVTVLRFVILCMLMMHYFNASENDITFKNK